MTTIDAALPRWSTADVHASLDARSFVDALERGAAAVDRLVALFDELDIRAGEHRPPTAADGEAADRVIDAYNRASQELEVVGACATAAVAADTGDALAQSRLSEIESTQARLRPLLARLADWVSALGADALAEVSEQAREHVGPLQRFAERSAHQMTETEEHLYAELATTGSGAWGRLQRTLTSQVVAHVELPGGAETLPIAAVRGLAADPDARVRRAAYDAELAAWPTIAVPVAAAMNAIKGEANAVNRRRSWESPLDASLFANSVSRPTYEAMQAAVTDALGDFRRWMRTKASVLGHPSGLPWWDLVAPLPAASGVSGGMTWDEGIDLVRTAFAGYSPALGGMVDRALRERWVDAEPRRGKSGGAFCQPFVDDRSLVLLNWSGTTASAQVTAHEFGHAYHNTTLARRTPLQRRLPMALAETASIFCETLVTEATLADTADAERVALLDVDLQNANMIVVDIRSRLLFEQDVFARRQRRTLSAAELSEMMLAAQAEAYGDGLDQSTAHRYMWLLKPHYYGAHFYNWPYTYGLLFGLGLYDRYRDDPDRFRTGYDDVLSRAGMDTAEELGAAFGLDVTDEGFWTASLDVLRARIAEYERLAGPPTISPSAAPSA